MSVTMAECGIRWRTHDPVVVLTHLGVAIADGADRLADVAVLKEQEGLFGPVASVATPWRAAYATAQVRHRGMPASKTGAQIGRTADWPISLRRLLRERAPGSIPSSTEPICHLDPRSRGLGSAGRGCRR